MCVRVLFSVQFFQSLNQQSRCTVVQLYSSFVSIVFFLPFVVFGVSPFWTLRLFSFRFGKRKDKVIPLELKICRRVFSILS